VSSSFSDSSGSRLVLTTIRFSGQPSFTYINLHQNHNRLHHHRPHYHDRSPSHTTIHSLNHHRPFRPSLVQHLPRRWVKDRTWVATPGRTPATIDWHIAEQSACGAQLYNTCMHCLAEFGDQHTGYHRNACITAREMGVECNARLVLAVIDDGSGYLRALRCAVLDA